MSPKPTIHKNTKLPLTIFYTEKFQIKNGKICSASNNHIDKNDSPYMVEVLNANRISSIDRKGTLATRKITNVGSQLPKEIVAVVRARLSNPYETKESCVTNVVDKSLAMHLEVKVLDFVLDETSVTKMDEEARVIYNKIAMSCDKQRMQGLYCFNTKGNQLEHLLTQMGTYMFHFSLIGTKYGDVPATVLHVNIAPHNTLIPKHHVPQVLPRKKDFAKRLDISSQSNKNDEVKNEVENNDDNHLHPDKTIIHVTTLDELVQKEER
ncbi:uncharacterized protein [Physcomitrium patens]|uniref:uncharacterized protein isoform X2 n=1 Tax=Physcomitrium patens TaxID=3218 RepID=UPI003CCE185E